MNCHHPKIKGLERAAAEFCAKLWTDPLSCCTLLMYGENGTGKTHCAKAIYEWVQKVGWGKQFIERPGHISSIDAVYWNWQVLLDRMKGGEWDLLQSIKEPTVMVLDDVGASHDPTKVGVDKLCKVLSERDRRWNVITTNVLPEAWEEVFDQRVASRFLRQAVLVDLSDVPDYASVSD